MSPARSTSPSHPYGFPRVSGDEPPGGYSETLAGLFSPRERG